MKKYLLTLILASSPILLNAKTIVLTVPDNMFSNSTTYSANFDGSVNIKNPKVFIDGNFIDLRGTQNGYEDTSAKGICKILNKKYYTSSSDDGSGPNVLLNSDGSIHKIFPDNDGYNLIVQSITCK